MKALITGASSGLGREFAKQLSNLGYDLVLVARRKNKLEQLKKELNVKVDIICLDLSNPHNCISLYEKLKDEDIHILINNAGFGLFGEFVQTDLHQELQMIDTNIKAVHILTKLFLQDFIKKNQGYILNVSSSASFFSGPLMSTYYGTKNYVTRLTEAIYQELKETKSQVYIGALCPGPVETEFNQVANVEFSLHSLQAKEVVRYAIKKMFQRKLIIIPGIQNKLVCLSHSIIPRKVLLKINYHVQKRKDKNMKNKKGFTLVELLSILVILSLIFGIIVPNISKSVSNKKQEITNYQKKIIEEAAESYTTNQINDENLDCTTTTVTVEKLIDDGYLTDDYNPYKSYHVEIKCTNKSENDVYSYTLIES